MKRLTATLAVLAVAATLTPTNSQRASELDPSFPIVAVEPYKVTVSCKEADTKLDRVGFILEGKDYSCTARVRINPQSIWPGNRSFTVIHGSAEMNAKSSQANTLGTPTIFFPYDSSSSNSNLLAYVKSSNSLIDVRFVSDNSFNLLKDYPRGKVKALTMGGMFTVCAYPLKQSEHPCVRYVFNSQGIPVYNKS